MTHQWTAHADSVPAESDCTDYHLEVGIELGYLPAQRQQLGSGWCYAFVAADLLSHRFRTPISAADIALNYINHGRLAQNRIEKSDTNSGNMRRPAGGIQAAYPLGGGLVDEALHLLNGRGVCLESELSFSATIPQNTNFDLSQHFSSSSWPDVQRRLRHIVEKSSSENHSANFKNALIHLGSQRKCRPHFREKKFNTVTEMRSEPENRSLEFNRKLNRDLTRFRMLAIDYNSQVLSAGHEAPWTQSNHASLLIGRRFNKNKNRCEYLLRNNEKGCADYVAGLECHPTYNHVWVPSDRILRSISSYTYLR